MELVVGFALLCTSVLMVVTLKPRASGAAPRFMNRAGMDDLMAVVVTIIIAFGISATIAGIAEFF